MAPFQVNGNTQGLFGLAPPLVKHSGGGAGCAGGILGGEGFGLFGGGLCPMLPAPNVKQDNDFVSQSPHCLLITSPSPSTWVAHHSAPLPL
jgi:hypothetical protein